MPANSALQNVGLGFVGYRSEPMSHKYKGVQMDLEARLSTRSQRSPEEFNITLKSLEEQHEKAGYKTEASAEDLLPGTYYLVKVDCKFRRTYVRKVFSSDKQLSKS